MAQASLAMVNGSFIASIRKAAESAGSA